MIAKYKKELNNNRNNLSLLYTNKTFHLMIFYLKKQNTKIIYNFSFFHHHYYFYQIYLKKNYNY